MTPSISKTLSALLLTLATLPALADQADSVMFGQPFIKLAQLSPEERRSLRERWEQAGPEERIRMRQYFQDRLRQLPQPPLPPEARDAMRLPFPGMPLRESGREREESRRAPPPSDSTFGFGFEKRRFEEDRPAWPGSRRPSDEERR